MIQIPRLSSFSCLPHLPILSDSQFAVFGLLKSFRDVLATVPRCLNKFPFQFFVFLCFLPTEAIPPRLQSRAHSAPTRPTTRGRRRRCRGEMIKAWAKKSFPALSVFFVYLRRVSDLLVASGVNMLCLSLSTMLKHCLPTSFKKFFATLRNHKSDPAATHAPHVFPHECLMDF